MYRCRSAARGSGKRIRSLPEAPIPFFRMNSSSTKSGLRHALTWKKPPDERKLCLEWFTKHQCSVTGSSHAWNREVFDFFGPLGDQVVSEDVVIPFRSLLLGTIKYIDEPLVLRRFTGSNLTLGEIRLWDREMTSEIFLERTHQNARNFEAVYAMRAQDIEKMSAKCPERNEELSKLRTASERNLSKAKAEERFWRSSNSRKFLILMVEFIGRGWFRTASRLLISWLFPQFLMRWIHIRSFKSRGKLSFNQKSQPLDEISYNKSSKN